MSLALEKYCNEKNMTIEQKNEIKNLFIDMLLENCTIQTQNLKIDNTINNSVKPMEIDQPPQIPAPVPPQVKDTTTKKAKSAKKFSTVKTAEFANENGVSLDDFETEDKISKADIVQFLKKRGTEEVSKPSTSSDNGKKPKQTPSQREPCHGLTKTGDVCKTRAKADRPEGASFHYCPKHFDTWKLYEAQSDTECEDTDCEEDGCKDVDIEDVNVEVKAPELTEADGAEEQDEFEDEGAEVTEEDLFN